MSMFIIIGTVLTLAGLAGVLWCIRKAVWLKKAKLEDAEARSELNTLVFAHMAAIGAAFMGLGLLIVGILLS